MKKSIVYIGRIILVSIVLALVITIETLVTRAIFGYMPDIVLILLSVVNVLWFRLVLKKLHPLPLT